MKILVTGAAGLLGKVVCRELISCGYDVVAADLCVDGRLGYPVVEADVLDREGCYELVAGCDCVVHLANCTRWHDRSVQAVYVDNVSMNINVFQAAVESGVRRIIFASTVQVLTGFQANIPRESHETLFRYLPADSDTESFPRNPYSLSKVAGEQILDVLVDLHGVAAVSIRFPVILENGLESLKKMDTGPRENAFDLYAHLSTVSAAELVRCCVSADTTGHRRYFPAAKGNLQALTPCEAYERKLSHLELRCPLEELDRLVDCSQIEAETGWVQPEL